MPQAADDPIEPIEPDPAAADELSELAAMRATIELYRREKEALLAQIAERDARDVAEWVPLKRAAGSIPMPYENARAWAERAIEGGRLHEANKPAGRVIVNVTALRKYHATKK